MITKKDIITDAILDADIKDLPKDYNRGKSKAIEKVFNLNESGKRLRIQWKQAGKAKRAKAMLARNAKPNGMAIANARLKYALSQNKNK